MEELSLQSIEKRKEELQEEIRSNINRHKKPVLPIVFMGISFLVALIFLMVFIATTKVAFIVVTVIFVVIGLIFLFVMIAIINGNKPINLEIAKCRRELNEVNKKIEFCHMNQPASSSKPSETKSVSTPSSTKTQHVESETGDQIVFKGVRGAQKVLDVYEDRIVLTQIQNVRSFFTHDLFKGSKEIYYADMTSIQIKIASGFILGYIQFEVPGIHSADNFTSENSWTYDTSMQSKANEIATYVKKKISEFKRGKAGITTVVQNQTSVADEIAKFKKLLDDGIITQEEFDEKKKQLLK